MTITAPRRPRRKRALAVPSLVQMGVIAAATFVSAQVLTSGLVARLAGQQPEPAVSLGFTPAAALLRLSENQRTFQPDTSVDPDPQADKAAAKRQADLAWATGLEALAKDPMSAATLQALGQAADQRGDENETRRLMEAAAALSHRESAAEIWLTNDALRQKDYGRALAHIDDLLRAAPEAAGAATTVLTQLSVVPEASDALVNLLATDPPWRVGFLEQLPGQVSDPLSLEPLYSRLLSLRPPLPDAELKSFLDALIRHGEVGQAYYIWLKTLPEDRLADLGYLYDGDFRLRPSNLPFDWELDPIAGATTSIDAAPGENGQRALMVDFADGRVPYKNAAKLMVLPPGRYQLSGRVRALDLDSQRGMTWRVTCLDTSTQLGETPRVMGTTEGWEPFAITFTIPDSGCDAQWLRLEVAYRTTAEQKISGSIRYTNFKLDKIEVPAVPQPEPAAIGVAQPAAPARQPQPQAQPNSKPAKR